MSQDNTYETQLVNAGVWKPLSTILSNESTDRNAALGVTIKTYSNTSVIPSTFAGVAQTGDGVLYIGNGVSTTAAAYPGIAQVIISAAYTLVLANGGQQIYHTEATARTITIPANSVTPFAIGTAIMIINDVGAGVLTISTTDTLVWAVSGTTGPRTIAAAGMATLIKISATRWMISGAGVA